MVETDVIVGKNGVHIDPVTRKFIKGGKPSTAIATPSQASELAKRKHERKRERIQAGALAAVREKLPDKFEGDGDDWIEAIAEAITYKALDRLDPKQVDAARFLLQETGLSEAKQAQSEGGGVTLHVGAEALQALAAWIGGDNYNYRKHEVVEGAAVDTVPAQADDEDKDSG